MTTEKKQMQSVWIAKVSSNDSTPLLYFPKKLREVFGIRKGDYFTILLDPAENRLILKKVELPIGEQSDAHTKEKAGGETE